MDELDNTILEYLETLGKPGGDAVAQPPTAVWVNIAEIRELTEKRQNTVSRHMSDLADAGLLDRVDEKRGYYKLTDLGFQYVRNELSNEQIEEIKKAL